MNFVVAPNLSGFCDIARFGRIDAREYTDALAMLRVLPSRHVDPVFVKDGCRVYLTRAFRGRIFDRFALANFVFRWIAVVFPYRLEKAAVRFFHRLGVKSVAVAIATAEKYQFLSVYFAG